MTWVIVAVLALASVGCDGRIVSSGAVPADAGGADDGGAVAGCSRYPVFISADPQAKYPAFSALGTLGERYASKPTGHWNGSRGTFELIENLNIPLAGCTGSETVLAYLLPIVDAWPAVFMMELSEWEAPAVPMTCGDVGAGPSSLSLERRTYGPIGMNAGFIDFLVRRQDGVVTLVNAAGNYLPRADEEGAAGCMQAWAPAPLDSVVPGVMAQAYPYTVYEGVCEAGRLAAYTPNEADEIAFSGEPWWSWGGEAMDGVDVRLLRTVVIRVAPANVTDDMRKSSAYCDDIGFRLTIDAVTGEVVSSASGTNCIVC